MPPNTHDKLNVIVTGSSGLLGTAVIREFAQPYQVIGFDKDGQPQPPPQVECICVDLTDPKSVDLGFQRTRFAYGGHIAAVVHLAAYYDFSGDPSPLYDKITVQGTERLLKHLQEFQVGRFIFSSTMLVHKPTEPGKPINEDSPVEGRWPYPESKIRTEQVLREQRGDIPVVSLRIAGVYTDRCESLPIAQQIRRIYERQMTSHYFPGDTSHGQAFVHLDDLVDAIRRTVERRDELPPETIMLIGEPETYSYDQLQKQLGRLVHNEPDWQTQRVPEELAKAGIWIQDKVPGVEEPFIKPKMIQFADDHYELDISRAKELLGWQPQHRLIDTLPEMVEHLKADPQAWYSRHKFPPPD